MGPLPKRKGLNELFRVRRTSKAAKWVPEAAGSWRSLKGNWEGFRELEPSQKQPGGPLRASWKGWS